MRFTDRAIKALQPRQVRYEITEEGWAGLRIRVSPTGAKSWIFVYRRKVKLARWSGQKVVGPRLKITRVADIDLYYLYATSGPPASTSPRARGLNGYRHPVLPSSALRRSANRRTVSRRCRERIARNLKGDLGRP